MDLYWKQLDNVNMLLQQPDNSTLSHFSLQYTAGNKAHRRCPVYTCIKVTPLYLTA